MNKLLIFIFYQDSRHQAPKTVVGSRFCTKNQCLSAKGAEYNSQGQARSEAERVAPGSNTDRIRALKERNTGKCVENPDGAIPPFQG